jgi:hypothetical protein
MPSDTWIKCQIYDSLYVRYINQTGTLLYTTLPTNFNNLNKSVTLDADDIITNGRLTITNNINYDSSNNVDYFPLDISTNGYGSMRIFESIGTAPNATIGSLVLQHADASGASSIVFPSKSAYGLDYASIAYYESISGSVAGSKYNYYRDASSTTSSALVINVQRDVYNSTDPSSIDSIILNAAGSVIIDACGSSVGQTIIQPRGGNVGIGKTNPACALDVSGLVTINGSLFTTALDESALLTTSILSLDLSFSTNFAVINSLGASNWGAVSISANGQYQSAISSAYHYTPTMSASGSIYNSSDFGKTFTINTSAQTTQWTNIKVSSSGKYQIGTTYAGTVYTSNNYGVTWTYQAGLAATAYSTFTVDAVAWDGTRFLVVGESGRAATSP